jgi:hypothetical protein
MRALGPGSVSSLLKVVLDVVFVALWAGLGMCVAGVLLALMLPVDLDVWRGFPPQMRGPIIAAALLALSVYLAVVLLIVDRVRRIFMTLMAGDPFDPTNVTRLRAVGFCLIALELISYCINFFGWYLHEWFRWSHSTFNPTAWFAVLVVFVLAEVFREGARLRAEAELTI